MYKEIVQCRVCGNPRLDPILHLGMQALTGVFPRPGEIVPEGPLEVVKCREQTGSDTCGLVQLRHSFEPGQMYGENYGYRSGLNRSMVSHLEGIARYAKAAVAFAPGDVILDIGSNDSTLLQAFAEPGITAVGMDPTGIKFKAFYPEDVRLIPEFFSAQRYFHQVGRKRAKIVSSIAMFYDLEKPLDFMAQVAEVLAEDGVWVFEQSYLPSMIAQNSYDTICHEHLEYYRLKQIIWMAERVGLKIQDVELNSANGGSFRVLARHAEVSVTALPPKVASVLEAEESKGFDRMSTYSAFSQRVDEHRRALRKFLEELHADRKTILGYGASTKGNVLLQFCGFGPEDLPYIAEVNPDKFGRLTPGTSIPIISEAEALKLEPDAFLVLPWHFRNDFLSRADKYLTGGRAFVFPLPSIEVFRNAQSASNRI